jgi:uncharacterized membrane protein YczE
MTQRATGTGVRRLTQLVLSCVVLGVGVALLLSASLGSDGYSTLVSGLARATGAPFVVANCAVGAVLIALAAWRGQYPGWGTLVQPVVVGLTVSAVLALAGTPAGLGTRVLLLAAAFPVLALGVAGYLGSGSGAGPTEAAALAFDPPLPFRWSYAVVQVGGALAGWLMGAAVGPGTVLVSVLIGPAVGLLSARVPGLDVHASASRPEAGRTTAR